MAAIALGQGDVPVPPVVSVPETAGQGVDLVHPISIVADNSAIISFIGPIYYPKGSVKNSIDQWLP
jgi:hypothetical protein